MSILCPKHVLLVLLLGSLSLVASCREDEQDRVLFEEKGVYQGEPDQPLSEQQLDVLRQRASNQRI